MPSNLTMEEKKELNRLRQNAVRYAWTNEKMRVQNGHGTREWSVIEQRELLEKSSVSGYEGHHMKSVSIFPKEAGNPENIQFLTEEEHFYGAHQGSYHTPTNGYYDPNTETMMEFNGDELISVPVIELKEQYIETSLFQLDDARKEYMKTHGEMYEETKASQEMLEKAREEYMSREGNYVNSINNEMQLES